MIYCSQHYNQYLNCKGDASPYQKLPSPHQDWASPHRDLSAGWSEEKEQQIAVEYSTKFCGKSDSVGETLESSGKTFFNFGDEIT